MEFQMEILMHPTIESQIDLWSQSAKIENQWIQNLFDTDAIQPMV